MNTAMPYLVIIFAQSVALILMGGILFYAVVADGREQKHRRMLEERALEREYSRR